MTGDAPPVAVREVALETTCAEDPAFAYAWHCNRDSELEQGLTVDRDECDYDPCGLSDMDTDSWTNQVGVEFNRTSVFATDGRRKAGTDDIRTGWRFCRCTSAADDTAETRVACQSQLPDGTGLCLIDEVGVGQFDDPGIVPWRRMRLTNHFGGAGIGETTDITYDGPNQRPAASTDLTCTTRSSSGRSVSTGTSTETPRTSTSSRSSPVTTCGA